MRSRWIGFLVLASLAGCSWVSDSRKYSVYFEPYSAELNQQAHDTIAAAASFAQSHPAQPIAIDGFSAPPDPNQDVDGLSAKRAETVKQALVIDGVSPNRITTSANGVADPKNLPTVAVRRVDVSVGRP
jgi:outer membrane protein OmpA-like peptidoglycan-associated protein